MANITIYTTPTCAYCKMTKEFFKENNVQYTEMDVTTNPQAREEMIKKSDQMGVPVTDIDGNIVIGFDKEKLTELIGLNK